LPLPLYPQCLINDYRIANLKIVLLYEKDLKTRRAVERNLSIIGEAMNRILKKEPAIELTDIRLIIATRNRIIHGYETISNLVIWEIVQNDLPVLKKEIEAIMSKE
jgi:uncharacterized protein with HEPN domain